MRQITSGPEVPLVPIHIELSAPQYHGVLDAAGLIERLQTTRS